MRRIGLLRGLLAMGLLVATIFISVSFMIFDYLDVFAFDKKTLLKITQYVPPNNTVVLSKDGEVIGELYDSYHVFKQFSELPKDLVNAVVAVEDKNFWQHSGFDIEGILRAFWVNLLHAKGQGASTLTQQVVRSFLLTNEKSIARKIREIFLSIELEKVLKKEEILQIYANSFFLGHGAYGVGAAARKYFNKELSELKTHELAFIAGLFQAPGRFGAAKDKEAAKFRQEQVLQAMVRNGYLSPAKGRALIDKPLEFRRFHPPNSKIAPFFLDYVDQEAHRLLGLESLKGKGLQIRTTLDLRQQQKLQNALKDSETLLAKFEGRIRHKNTEKRERLEAASVVSEPSSGKILALIGGRDYQKSQFNRVTSALRQPGSLFKVVVYSLALSRGYKWNDVMMVAPVNFDGDYRPRSATNEYMKETTLLRAFYRSINAPALELGQALSVDEVIEHAQKLGVESKLKPELGTVLGSSEISMLEMASLYSVFASGGLKVKPYAIEKIEDNQGKVLYQHLATKELRVINKELAFLITEGMRQVLLRGTANSASSLAEYAVGKTGTSNQAKDNWFAGFSEHLLCLVWVGVDVPTPIYEASGANLALPIWQSYMEQAIDKSRPAFKESSFGVISLIIDPVYGKLSKTGIPMWFLAANQPSVKAKGRVYKIDTEFRKPFSELPVD